MQEIFVLTTKFISISLVIVNMNCVNYAYTQSDNNSFIGEELSTLAEDLQTGAYFAKLGFQYSKQGDYGAAQRSFQTAIRLQPNLTVAHAGLGFVFLQQNIFKEAIAAYQKAIQINPDFIQIYKDLGLAYTKYEQYDEAIQTYKRAIQLFPKSADLHRTLGSTYMILGGFHKAKLAYRKSLELEPNVAAVHDNLGTIYKNDGSLDLYITNYADYDLERDRRCEIGGVWVYCGPRSYPPDVDVCYRNNGNGTFTDFSQQSGILNVAAGHGLGVTFGDYDNDGDSDLYVANDRDPNFLFYNQGDGMFEEVALMLGVAYNDMGDEEAGMGTAFGDYNNDGFLDLTVSNFQNETNTVYRNDNGDFFEDATTTAGIAEVTHNFLGWGINFFDYDNDGYKDIFVANGHVMDNINQVNKHVVFPQKNLLFRNLSDGTFRNISDHSGLALEKVSRAVAFGDYDNDGDIDILVTNWNQTPDLLRNDIGNQKNWIQINAVGIKSNRSAIGARAKIVAGNLIQYQEVNSSNGYLSFSDLRLHFGLGSFQKVDTLEIRWPSGRIDKSVNLEVNQRYIATEGIGVQVY